MGILGKPVLLEKAVKEPYIEVELENFQGRYRMGFKGFTKIDKEMFKGNPLLTRLDLSGSPGLAKIMTSAFQGCGLLKSMTLPDAPVVIYGGAFQSCIGLQEVTIPAGATLKGTCFGDCTHLVAVRFRGTPVSVASGVFSSCSALTDLYVPWEEGEVAGAPWGATNATIHYSYTEEGET